MAFRWLELSKSLRGYRAYKAIIKHYENERFCNTCNHKWCDKIYKDNRTHIDDFGMVMDNHEFIAEECYANNHKHWERG